MRFLQTACIATVASLLLAPAVSAQDQTYDAPPAHIAFVDGAATLDRESESEPATAGLPLVEGDRLSTTSGRAEILFPDGTALDLDEQTTVELQSPTLLRLVSGRILLVVSGAAAPTTAATFHVDTPVAGVDTYGPGEYRVSVLPGRNGVETELAVIRGSAALTDDQGSMPLQAGQRSLVWDGAPPTYPQPFNSARFDAFDRWANARRDDRRGARSAQYLPQDLRPYGGTFDRDGSWEYDNTYSSYVWYPSVAADWRPYYDGYWAPVPAYGWTWVGVDLWSWPTHHYGRWGVNGRRWFWIPDRRWAPAWVSWGAAPGYVSWSPLGFDNRPVFALSASFGHGWSSWVVLPRDHFGARVRSVRQWTVATHRFPARTPFVTHTTAPIPLPRQTRRVAGSVATSPRQQVPASSRQWQIRQPDSNRRGASGQERAEGVNGSIRSAPGAERSSGVAGPRSTGRSAVDPGSPVYSVPGGGRTAPATPPVDGSTADPPRSGVAVPQGSGRSVRTPESPTYSIGPNTRQSAPATPSDGGAVSDPSRSGIAGPRRAERPARAPQPPTYSTVPDARRTAPGPSYGGSRPDAASGVAVPGSPRDGGGATHPIYAPRYAPAQPQPPAAPPSPGASPTPYDGRARSRSSATAPSGDDTARASAGSGRSRREAAAPPQDAAGAHPPAEAGRRAAPRNQRGQSAGAPASQPAESAPAARSGDRGSRRQR